MNQIDINCDFGEWIEPIQITQISEILQYVSSVNIACGFHAGNPTTMRIAVDSALKHDVKIGAHPGYNDLDGFGRRELDVTSQEVYDLVLYQIGALDGYVKRHGVSLHHVKPHGALYNKAAVSDETSKAIAQAVYDYSPKLKLYTLANSRTVKIAKEVGLDVFEEAFIDRTYENNGLLTSRKEEGSIIENASEAIDQTLQIITKQMVVSTSNHAIPLKADTICVHGDHENAVQFAKQIHQRLLARGYKVN